MPVYEYWCEAHGPFEAMRPMAEFGAPCACPDCGEDAPRVMLTVPNIANMPGEKRVAHATNERSADSPKRASTHGPNCGCCGGGKKAGRKTMHRPDGSKSFPSARPWMISH